MSLTTLPTQADRMAKPSHVAFVGVNTGKSDVRTHFEAPRVPWPGDLPMTIVNVCRFVRAGTGGVQMPPTVAVRVNVYEPATRGVPDIVMVGPSKVRPGGIKPLMNAADGVHAPPNQDVMNWKEYPVPSVPVVGALMMNAKGPKPLNFISYWTAFFRPSASVTSTVMGRLPV